MRNKRIVILISGSGSNLQAFIDAQRNQALNGEIVAVISNKADAYGLTRAEQAGITHHSIAHTDFPDRLSFDRSMIATINTFEPDLVVLAGFMRILTPEFVQNFQGKLLNIHPSLLPKYPGLNTHKQVIENNDEYHGSSVHFVTEELDGGPIIAQYRLKTHYQKDEQALISRVLNLEHQLYPQVTQWFLEGRLTMQENMAYLDNQPLKTPVIFDSAE